MSHRNRNEQRTWKARKDPHKLARPTRIHKVKTSEIFRRQTEDEDVKFAAEEHEDFLEYMEGEE